MKSKNLISLTIGFCFIIMSISGIMLYLGQKQWHPIETLHILFGVIFLGFAIFHILNNWSSITGYSKSRKDNKWQKEFMVAASIFGVFLIGGSLEVPPFMQMAHGFKQLLGGKRERKEMVSFDSVKTNQDSKGTEINIILQKGKDVEIPVMAVWVEDSAHNFVENLFVPAQTIEPEERGEPIGKMLAEGEVKFNALDSKLLPTFDQKAKIKTATFDKFTPVDNFILNSKTTLNGNGFVVLEVKNNDKVEVYQSAISVAKKGAYALTSENASILNRAIAEINR